MRSAKKDKKDEKEQLGRMKRADELKKLIALGKEKGRLTYEEVNNLLPEDVTSSEEIEEILTALGNENIEIVDSEETDAKSETPAEEKEDSADTPEAGDFHGDLPSEEKAEEETEAPSRSEPVDDPVRKYLRQMGQISLLSREDELRLAKEIKEAEANYREILLSTVMVPRELLALVDRIKNKEVNWMRLEESVRLAIRQLDNLIDINILPIPEAVKSDRENRAIGLGVMGFADTLEQFGIAYDSDHAANFADRVFEFISYMAIDESANLAEERGSYQNFSGSMWSKGFVPFDTLSVVESSRGVPLTVDKTSHHRGLNWDLLREKVRKGMRNATLMAIAPTANIGLLAGVTPGIDVRFAQIFSRNKFSGKYIDINRNLVKDLKNLGMWDTVKEAILENQGDISSIELIPQHIKDVYKTSFSTSPFAVIEIAARAQKWIDQALSRNMYLETRDTDEIMNIYKTAWEKGLKSTYYLHMKPRHTAEQSTTNVNKATKIGKVGFGALNFANSPAFSAPLQKSFRIDDSAPDEPLFVVPQTAPQEVTLEKEKMIIETSIVSPISSNESMVIKETIQVMETEDEPMVSVRITHTPPEVTNTDTGQIGPEDPAEDEGNICISCQ